MPQKGSKKPNVSKALKGKVFAGTFKKGHAFMPGGEKGWFKNGQKAWNKETKGVMKANSGSFTLPVSKYPNLRYVIENLITLCPNCHRRKTNLYLKELYSKKSLCPLN